MRFRGTATAALLASVALSTVACTGAPPAGQAPGDPAVSEGYAANPATLAQPGGRGSIAPALPESARPGRAPVQAGPELAGRALPTNQWWSSALTGPLTQPMWAFPLALRVAPDGIAVSSAAPVASADSVLTPFAPAVVAGGPVEAVRVAGYGAFHVALRVSLAGGGSVEVTLVQGSPVLYLRFVGTAPVLRLRGGDRRVTVDAGRARLETDGQRWDILGGTDWQSTVDTLTARGARDGRIAVARVPDGADDAAWRAAVQASAADPVVDTTAGATYDATTGTVIQTLVARRASGGPGVWALLPHQRAGLVSDPDTRELAGGYGTPRGQLSLVDTRAVRVRVPLPGLLPGVPAVDLADPARAAVLADLDTDLADPAPGGGSYFGLKEAARLATIAEVAAAVGAHDRRRAALDRLRPQLEDWLTYSGGTDGRYFGYDPTWGGLVAVPAEFGSQDYNDHHFQYGYLVRAAAVLAAADPAFATDYGATVDLVVREYTGVRGGDGFPPFRVFNAYLGSSAASGYAAFADGNNQESSSEAVAAWEAVVRWGLVRGDADLVTYGLAHYALEADTARRYWLGEGTTRPAGYAHRGAGIVWDAKLDYATWFDPKPESVQGIQLLPVTFGSLYRADPAAARERAGDLAALAGGAPRVWGDLFATDLALADPAAARERLTPALPRETSTSRAVVRYLVEVLARLGPPQPAVTADGPFGLAFGPADTPTLVTADPTGQDRTVTFRRAGTVVAQIPLKGRAPS